MSKFNVLHHFIKWSERGKVLCSKQSLRDSNFFYSTALPSSLAWKSSIAFFVLRNFIKKGVGETCGTFWGPGLANFTAGHSQLDKTAIEAEEGSFPVTQEENETGFFEHIGFSLQELSPFHLL